MTDGQKRSNGRVVIIALSVVIGMGLLTFIGGPWLYRHFCAVTGYGGTPKRVSAEDATGEVVNRDMTVRFAANVNYNMPWEFKPEQNKQKIKVGEQKVAYFSAYNPTDKTITGRASYNITPDKAATYFAKIDCFCFTLQTLKPHERADMPVVYYIDPEIVKDHDVDDVNEVTLSYTFFVVKDADKDQGDAKPVAQNVQSVEVKK